MRTKVMLVVTLAILFIGLVQAREAAAQECSIDWGCYSYNPGYQVCISNKQTIKNMCYSAVPGRCAQSCGCPGGYCGEEQWACDFACRISEEGSCESQYCSDIESCYSNHCYFG